MVVLPRMKSFEKWPRLHDLIFVCVDLNETWINRHCWFFVVEPVLRLCHWWTIDWSIHCLIDRFIVWLIDSLIGWLTVCDSLLSCVFTLMSRNYLIFENFLLKHIILGSHLERRLINIKGRCHVFHPPSHVTNGEIESSKKAPEEKLQLDWVYPF